MKRLPHQARYEDGKQLGSYNASHVKGAPSRALLEAREKARKRKKRPGVRASIEMEDSGGGPLG